MTAPDLLDDLNATTPCLVRVCFELQVSIEDALTALPPEAPRQILLWIVPFL
jgi:hypothetical protein